MLAGDIFFRAAEGSLHFIYRMKEDGTGRQKVVPDPVIIFWGVSPDGQWLVADVAVSGEETPEAVFAYPS